MRAATNLFLLGILVALATACKKEVETISVDKVYSWTPVKQLWGIRTNIVGMTAGVNIVNIQSTGFFEVLSPIPGSKEQAQNSYYTGLSSLSRTWVFDPMPFDIRNRVPMNANFYANPGGYRDVSSDTVLTIYPTSYFDGPAYLHLHQLDPHAVQFENRLLGSTLPFGVINRNDYLLCSYYTDNPAANNGFNLVLSKLVTGPTPVPRAGFSATRTLITSQVIRVPTSTPRTERASKLLWAIDDYFLVWCESAGLYKVRQDGTVKLVSGPPFTNGPLNPSTIYKWQGTVYSIQPQLGGSTSFFTSTDDGETWQKITDVNQALYFSTFYPVGDSLVGVTHGDISNRLYTMRWLTPNSLRLRELKNDGPGFAYYSDLVQLSDTVYLGTSNGLFKRPLKQFFESKK